MTTVTFIECLPCARHCCRPFICIKFNPHQSLMVVLILHMRHREVKEPRALQLVSSTVVI